METSVPDWDEKEEAVGSEMPIIKYDTNEAYIAEVTERYKDIDIKPGDKDDYEMVMAGLREHRKIRLAIEERRKWNNKDAKAYIDANNARAKELHALNDPHEQRLKAVRQVEDDRVKAIEQERTNAIRQKIADINRLNSGLESKTAEELGRMHDALQNTELLKEDFEEFLGEAMAEAHNTLIHIKQAWDNRVAFDKAEEERLRLEAEQKKEAERLEKLRLEQEEAQRRIDEQNRVIREQQEALEREKARIVAEIAEEERRKREAKMVREAEERARQEEKERIEREKLEQEAKEKAEEESRLQQEALKPDKQKLSEWIIGFDLEHHPKPDLESDVMKEILCDAIADLEIWQNDVMDKIEQL